MLYQSLESISPDATDEEKYWVLLSFYLEQLHEAERNFIEALSVFHWFDDDIAEYIWTGLGQGISYLQAWNTVTNLPFIDIFSSRGMAFHELYRNALLFHLWRDKKEWFLKIAGRAAKYFESDDPFSRIEQAYHLLISDPSKGRTIYRDIVVDFQDSGRFSAWHTLNQYGLEHVCYGRLDLQSTALVWEAAGQISSIHGKNQEAIERLKAAQSLYAQTGDRESLIRVLYSNAAYQSLIGQAEECKSDLRAACEIALQIGEPLYTGYIMYRIAEQTNFEGNPGGAYSLYQKSLEWFEAAGDYAMQARNLMFMAETTDPTRIEDQKALYQKAIPLFEQGWSLYSQMSPDDPAFSPATFIGGFASRTKVKTFRLFNTAIDKGDCLVSLADLLEGLEDPEVCTRYHKRALISYQRALPLAEQMKDLRWSARVNLRVGDAYVKLRQLEIASPYYQQALEEAKRTAHKLYIGWAYVGRGNIARLAGDKETARTYYLQARELYLEVGAHANIRWQITPNLEMLDKSGENGYN